LVIDGVTCEKSKSSTKTEAAKLQYADSEKGRVNCNVVVSYYYVGRRRDFPVNLSPYVAADEFEEGENSPDFFTKIEFGKNSCWMPLKKVSSLKKSSSITGIFAMVLYLSCGLKEKTGSQLQRAMMSFIT